MCSGRRQNRRRSRHFYRFQDGDTLTDAEMESLLARVLGDKAERERLRADLAFDRSLRELLQPPSGEGQALSQARIIAEATLRNRRRQEATSPTATVEGGRTRSRLLRYAAAAIIVGFACGLLLVWLASRGQGPVPSKGPSVVQVPPSTQAYPEVAATGDLDVVTSGGLVRGALIRVGSSPAQVAMGGYCRLTAEPGSLLRLLGIPRKEAVSLEKGGVTCDVDSDRGTFEVRTALGTVRVHGITVHRPPCRRDGRQCAGREPAHQDPGRSGLCIDAGRELLHAGGGQPDGS